MNERVHEKHIISDIYDEKLYRGFVKTLNPSVKHNYATLTFNTDGAPLFKSSAYSIWPIFLMINELPIHVRSTELILAGLWFGKDKPNMNVFLGPYVDKMNILSKEGINCRIKDKDLNVKVFTLIGCLDSIARAPVMGFVQFNGCYGCPQCLHPGEWVRNKKDNPRSGTIKYTLQNKVPESRNLKDTKEHMKKVVESKDKKPVYGVKNPSNLINLIGFHLISGCVVDSMHCVSGVAKQFATMLFDNKTKSGLLSRNLIPNIYEILSSIKVPQQIARLTRTFTEKEFWKAREWENWTLFYSVLVLQSVLPTEKSEYILHWSLFVEAIYLLMKDKITDYEIDLADQLLHEFVAKAQKLYSKAAMTFNVHLLLHLAKSVSDWGPLWAHSAFAFEVGNGDLLNVIHAAKGIHHQICRRISLKCSLVALYFNLYSSSCSTVKHYYDHIRTKFVKKIISNFEYKIF